MKRQCQISFLREQLWLLHHLIQTVLAVYDCFKHAAGQDIFLLGWRQVLSYDVSLLNIRLIVNSAFDLVQFNYI
jgi:hypothetical protein